MTIAIKITNSDSRETAVVKVCEVNPNPGRSMIPFITKRAELKGGESTELYVHSGQSLIVEEVRNG